MYSFLIFVSIIVSLLLIVAVLMQASKGEGLAGTFGGAGNFGTMFGTRRTADFLSKATWWLGGALLVLALLINLLFLPRIEGNSNRESVIQSSSQQAVPTSPVLPQQSLPSQQNNNSK
ncbi:preprotein translocase subunit SecG [Melioribacteraceae bacterium 4301-Me]|uniref:preprotein translocase subunit SecG n=1 Tax=Pyranulibacter aquaticus TaxID=3163344 RepID=UPI00359BAC20